MNKHPSGRASQLFQAIPSELSKNASRYQVSSVLSDSERKNLSEVLDLKKDEETTLLPVFMTLFL